MILRLIWIQNASSRNAPKIPGLLYARLNMTSPVRANRNRSPSIFNRLISYGESKWQELGRHPSHSIRGRVYQVGNRLIDRILMQERMLWRVHTFMEQAGKMSHLPAIECSPSAASTRTGLQQALGKEVNEWIRIHQRWRLIHGMAVIPAVLLSVLPFVKMWLAWEVFRTITHHRALLAARWIRQGLRRAKFEPNQELSTSSYAAIDEELPAIVRRAFPIDEN